MKYSLFLLEKEVFITANYIGGKASKITEKCMEYVETYNTLEEAQIAQKEYKQKTIILPSY
jgi:hypothetical protein